MATITPLPTPPSRDDPANFSDRADAYLGAFPLLTEQINAAVAEAVAAAATAINAPGTAASSGTSLPIGTGAKVLAIQPGKAFAIGQFVLIARSSAPSSYMHGQVTAHDPDTGSLTVLVTATAGTGTFAGWTVTLAPPQVFLPLSGGRLTGDLDVDGRLYASTPNSGTTGAVRIRGNQASGRAIIQFLAADGQGQWGYFTCNAAGVATVGENMIWHAGNDGAGSGLDADLLDGKQASDFYPANGGYIPGAVAASSVEARGTTDVGQVIFHRPGSVQYVAGGFGNGFRWGVKRIDRDKPAIAIDNNYDVYVETNFTVAQALIVSSGTGYYAGNSAWHAGNDGAGSGLDADLLDGRQASDFLSITGGTVNGSIRTTGILDGQTPNASTTGGVRIRASAQSGFAYLQITNADASSEWANAQIDANGTFTWSKALRAGTIIGTSDARVKENIRPIADPLQKLRALKGVLYRLTATGEESAGVLAQDVEKVLPELVYETDGVLGVNYNGLVGLLIEVGNVLADRVEARA